MSVNCSFYIEESKIKTRVIKSLYLGEVRMKEIIDKENLFCDENKEFILCEYEQELDLIRKLICVAEKGIEGHKPDNTWSFESVCYFFAKTTETKKC